MFTSYFVPNLTILPATMSLASIIETSSGLYLGRTTYEYHGILGRR